jgi:hypothetical protein
MVRGDLTPVNRKKIVALITTDVHGRDVTQTLIAKGVESLNDFDWQQQLRFYWIADGQEDDCFVRQVPTPTLIFHNTCCLCRMHALLPDILIILVRTVFLGTVSQANAQFRYGYEYMGVATRLVITPLTDRCWMTITGALHLKYEIPLYIAVLLFPPDISFKILSKDHDAKQSTFEHDFVVIIINSFWFHQVGCCSCRPGRHWQDRVHQGLGQSHGYLLHCLQLLGSSRVSYDGQTLLWSVPSWYLDLPRRVQSY